LDTAILSDRSLLSPSSLLLARSGFVQSVITFDLWFATNTIYLPSEH